MKISTPPRPMAPMPKGWRRPSRRDWRRPCRPPNARVPVPATSRRQSPRCQAFLPSHPRSSMPMSQPTGGRAWRNCSQQASEEREAREPCDDGSLPVPAAGLAAGHTRRHQSVRGLLAADTIRLNSAVTSSWDRSSGQAWTWSRAQRAHRSMVTWYSHRNRHISPLSGRRSGNGPRPSPRGRAAPGGPRGGPGAVYWLTKLCAGKTIGSSGLRPACCMSGISFPPNAWNFSADSQTSSTQRPPGVAPATWERQRGCSLDLRLCVSW